jgi:hypothetical protein
MNLRVGKVGLRLVNDAGTAVYRIDDPDAPERVQRLGAAWVAGR